MENLNAVISIIAKINTEANRLIVNELKKNSIEGLVTSHGEILNILFYENDGVPMNVLSSKIGKDKSTLTALIKKLEKYEFIEKCKSEKDSRSTIIKLTKKGEDLKPVFSKISDKLIATTYRGFQEEEKKILLELLEKIRGNFST